MPGVLEELTIADAYATSLYKGDPVSTDGSGNVIISTASIALRGVFMGCEYTLPSGQYVQSNYWPASTTVKSGTTIKARVQSDPLTIFEAQASGSMTATDVGTFRDIDLAVAGSAANGGLSGAQIGGAGDQLHVLAIAQVPQRDSSGNQQFSTTGANAVIHFRIINHELAGATAGVAT
jgi:hypothetical protein